MTITLDLQPEMQAGLVALANESGKTLEDYLLSVVERAVLVRSSRALSPQEKAALWRRTAKQFPDTSAPLSDEAVSRGSIYSDRE